MCAMRNAKRCEHTDRVITRLHTQEPQHAIILRMFTRTIRSQREQHGPLWLRSQKTHQRVAAVGQKGVPIT